MQCFFKAPLSGGTLSLSLGALALLHPRNLVARLSWLLTLLNRNILANSLTGDKPDVLGQTDRRTDICNSKVAFVAENDCKSCVG